MGVLLQIIGYGWTLFGIFNFFSVNDFNSPNEFQIAISVILHLFLYGGGLIVGGLGSLISKRVKTKTPKVKEPMTQSN
jgi:hypothetical protein